MKGLEELSRGTTAERPLDVRAFWDILEPLLQERDIEPLEHIRKNLQDTEEDIWKMPDSLFDPIRGEASQLKKTHLLLSHIVAEPEQPYTLPVARQLFPYWLEQFKDAQDYLGIL